MRCQLVGAWGGGAPPAPVGKGGGWVRSTDPQIDSIEPLLLRLRKLARHLFEPIALALSACSRSGGSWSGGGRSGGGRSGGGRSGGGRSGGGRSGGGWSGGGWSGGSGGSGSTSSVQQRAELIVSVIVRAG